MDTFHAALAFIVISRSGCVEGWCDVQTLRTCSQKFDEYQDDVQVIFKSYDESRMTAACSTLGEVQDCLEPVLDHCSSEFKAQWTGLDDAFSYLCTAEGMDENKKYAPCFAKEALQSSGSACAAISQQVPAPRLDDTEEQKSARCLATNNFLNCVYNTVAQHCDKETADWQYSLTQRALQPMEDTRDCILGCAATRLSFLLMAVSFMMYFVLQ